MFQSLQNLRRNDGLWDKVCDFGKKTIERVSTGRVTGIKYMSRGTKNRISDFLRAKTVVKYINNIMISNSAPMRKRKGEWR